MLVQMSTAEPMSMNPDQTNRPSTTADELQPPDNSAAEVSAWMDGDELAVASVADRLGNLPDADIDTWHSYHLIGDVLRAGSPAGFLCSDVARSSARAKAYARSIVQQASAAPLTAASPATGASGVTVIEAGRSPNLSGAPAANDPEFRWKIVAGFASLAAVAAVAWSVVGGNGLLPDQGVVLAAAPVNRGSVPSVGATTQFLASAPEPVWVSTPQGVVLRDPRMEELMRTHRQSGGGPALQVPAGFLRAATHDAVQR